MIWANPLDVIQYARSSYCYNNVYIFQRIYWCKYINQVTYISSLEAEYQAIGIIIHKRSSKKKLKKVRHDYITGIFRDLFRGQISAPSQFKSEQKLPKIVSNSPHSLAVQFGENSMKIRQKIAKLQMYTFTQWCIYSWAIIKVNAIKLIWF